MEIINPSGGSEFETQPGRGNKNQERPWIGDLPGQGSEGPTDIPNKDDSCPTCGETFRGPHPSRRLGLGVNPNNPVAEPQNPLSSPGQYRGPQQGRGEHFDAGHQKRLIPGTNTPWGKPQRNPRRTSPIDEDSTAEERYQRERFGGMGGDFPYGKDDPESREGGYTGPYPAGDPSN